MTGNLENKKMQLQLTEDIVISGISGRFPESDNLDELKSNLYNHVDMITSDERRWPFDFYGLPNYLGKIRNLDKIDDKFFGILPVQANELDPQIRILLQTTYEAIIDAGVNPQTLQGSKTGVYVGNCFTETEDAKLANLDTVSVYSLVGTAKSTFANKLSVFFDFHGPSYALDCACSSSLLALQQALLAIRANQCDQAIVAGANICLRPATSCQFLKATMLSHDGSCKHMDAKANGYARSETVCSIFLQKRSSAKRVYATLIHAKTNTDGKKHSIAFPSWTAQRDLMIETADDVNVDPSSVEYVEAHGTGTSVGDPVETKAIAEAYCKNRNGPLLIGSIKSNLGHSEPASGLCSIAKMLLTFENNLIPANIHFDEPNPNIPELINGQVEVVVQNTPYHGGIVSVNSFGIGGVNVNALFKPLNKEIDDKNKFIDSDIPRIIAVTGITEEAVNHVFDFIEKNPDKVNQEFLALLHDISQTTANSGMNYRGYLLADKHPDGNVSFPREIKPVPEEKVPIWFVYSGMGSQWTSMARALMALDIFRESIYKSANILEKHNLDLLNILQSDDKQVLENTVAPFVAITAIQVALTDVLNSMGIKPDGIVGHSLGEIGCAYCDGALSHEQAILTSYWRGKCVDDSNVPKGLMAAVGLSPEETIARCPEGIVPACHNAIDSVTISGPYDEMVKFVEQLNSEDIFARIVKTGDAAYHCYYMNAVAPLLSSKMQQIIPERTLRSSKWICSSVPEADWDKDYAKYSSASYYVHNLTSKVLFYEAVQHVPKNAIIVEIAPHSLMQSILKRNLGSEITYINLMARNNNENNLNLTLSAIGKLYNNGVNFDISQLYPKVQYPVSRGTQSLSSLMKWDHSQSWNVTLYPDYFNLFKPYTVEINLQQKDLEFYQDHRVDGKILFPASGYLDLVLKFYAKIRGQPSTEFAAKFENVNFYRATMLTMDSLTKFEISLLESNGHFCISESGIPVVVGEVYFTEKSPLKYQHFLQKLADQNQSSNLVLNKENVYKDLRIRGYDYGELFQALEEIDTENMNGKIQFTNWVVFADNMLQLSIHTRPVKGLYLPVRIQTVNYDPEAFLGVVAKQKEENSNSKAVLGVIINEDINALIAPGLEIIGLKANLVPRRETNQIPILEKCIFNPYNDLKCIANKSMQDNLKNYIKTTTALASQLAAQLTDADLKKRISDASINIPESVINQFTDTEVNSHYTIARLLKKLVTENQNVKENFDTVQEALNQDLLSTICESQYFLRYTIDIVLENLPSSNFSVIELNGTSKSLEEKLRKYTELFSTHVNLKYNLSKLQPTESNNSVQLDENSANLVLFKDANVYCFSDLKTDYNSILTSAKKSLKDGGFLAAIFRSKITPAEEVLFSLQKVKINLNNNINEFVEQANENNLQLLSFRTDSLSTSVLLFRKMPDTPLDGTKQSVIEISNTNFDKWVEILKEKLREHQERPIGENIWLVSTDTPTNGIVGLVKCLRKEPGGDRIRCILSASEIDKNVLEHNEAHLFADSPYSKILKFDLVFNVFCGEKFGSFRHYELDQDEVDNKVESEHAYLNVETRGDLSSLKWYESTNKYWHLLPSHMKHPNFTFCNVYYAPLNFRDIMLASGRISANDLPEGFEASDCVLGVEFVGRDQAGRRVMGMLPSNGLATTVITQNPEFLWSIPDHWTMEDASTIPVAYLTAYYALIIRGRLQPTESVLIHSGSGAVGQAAITICLNMDCKVYTTVGSEEKKQYLRSLFSTLTDECFANSRDDTFEEHIMHQTRGKGVNVVLNSLADTKLQASVRCLAQRGRFLEIGKFDIAQNSSLGMSVFIKNIEFHGILVDALFDSKHDSAISVEEKKRLVKLFQDGIKSGTVRPLKRTVFDIEHVEDAFRFMASGKHIGKVVIKIREEEGRDRQVCAPKKLTISAITKTTFLPSKTYIVTGGLGGFGLELVNWMVKNNAKNIVITSRTGPKDAFQNLSLQKLKERDVNCIISTANIANIDETKELIEKATTLGSVGGIFNLAMILEDGLFENQTQKSFENVCSVKTLGTQNLDLISRMYCPQLDYFVCFSSASSGRGNAGQTNYAFANSSMERVCELRRAAGLHGLAIQWGAIGDVGVLFKSSKGSNDLIIGGTVPQRIQSCLNVLDRFLQLPGAVYSSMVAAKRKSETSDQKINLLNRIANIFGIKNCETLSPSSTLDELGMDSLIAVEVKQIMDKSLDKNFSMQEIRKMTIQELMQLSEGKSELSKTETSKRQKTVPRIELPTETFIKLNGAEIGSPVLIIPPLEGSFDLLKNVTEKFTQPAIGLNWTKTLKSVESLNEASDYYIEQLKSVITDGQYNLVGYSFGSLVALDIAIKLQKLEPSSKIKLVFLDASPITMFSFVDSYTRLRQANDYQSKLAETITNFILQIIPGSYEEVSKQFLPLDSDQQLLEKTAEILSQNGVPDTKPEDISEAVETFARKLNLILTYTTKEIFDGNIMLVRAEEMYSKFAEDYDVSKLITGKCILHILSGDHQTFIMKNSEDIAQLLDQYFH